MTAQGHVAEWLRNGLQNRVPRFNSGRGLHKINDLDDAPHHQKSRASVSSVWSGSPEITHPRAALGRTQAFPNRGARVGLCRAPAPLKGDHLRMSSLHGLAEALVHLEEIEFGPQAFAPVGRAERA